MRIERKRGDTYPIAIRTTDAQGDPLALTAETFTLSVSSVEDPTTAADIFTVLGTITDASTGRVEFAIGGTTAAGNYFFDIEMVDTNSKKRTIAKGDYRLIQDITK